MQRGFDAPHPVVRLREVWLILYERGIKLLAFAQLARGEQRIGEPEPGCKVIGSAFQRFPKSDSRFPVLPQRRLTGTEIIDPLKLIRCQPARALITDRS